MDRDLLEIGIAVQDFEAEEQIKDIVRELEDEKNSPLGDLVGGFISIFIATIMLEITKSLKENELITITS